MTYSIYTDIEIKWTYTTLAYMEHNYASHSYAEYRILSVRTKGNNYVSKASRRIRNATFSYVFFMKNLEF